MKVLFPSYVTSMANGEQAISRKSEMLFVRGKYRPPPQDRRLTLAGDSVVLISPVVSS